MSRLDRQAKRWAWLTLFVAICAVPMVWAGAMSVESGGYEFFPSVNVTNTNSTHGYQLGGSTAWYLSGSTLTDTNFPINVVATITGSGNGGIVSSAGPFHLNQSSQANAQLDTNGSTNTFYLAMKNTTIVDSASAVAHVLDTSNTLATSGAKIWSVRNNGTEKDYIGFNGDFSTVGQIFWESGSAAPGVLSATTNWTEVNANTSGVGVLLGANQTATPSAAAISLRQFNTTLTSGTLLEAVNNGSLEFAVDFQGGETVYGGITKSGGSGNFDWSASGGTFKTGTGTTTISATSGTGLSIASGSANIDLSATSGDLKLPSGAAMTLFSAYPNTAAGSSVFYGSHSLSDGTNSHRFNVLGLHVSDSTASSGTGNVVFTVVAGASTCTFTFTCATDLATGNSGTIKAGTGTCSFAGGNTLALTNTSSGCSVTQPVIKNVDVVGAWSN